VPGLMSGDWKRGTSRDSSASSLMRGQRRTYRLPRQPPTLTQRYLSGIPTLPDAERQLRDFGRRARAVLPECGRLSGRRPAGAVRQLRYVPRLRKRLRRPTCWSARVAMRRLSSSVTLVGLLSGGEFTGVGCILSCSSSKKLTEEAARAAARTAAGEAAATASGRRGRSRRSIEPPATADVRRPRGQR
jgi:hypothetical protein